MTHQAWGKTADEWPWAVPQLLTVACGRAQNKRFQEGSSLPTHTTSCV